MTQPVLFLAHGTPMNALRGNQFTDDWRRFIADRHPPRAILVISAHWETFGTFITASDHPRTIHDFSGFPQSLSEIRYPCPGEPELANHICHHSSGDIEPNSDRGLDHGVWSILVHLFPNANIPVLQLSLDRGKSPAEFLALGRSLRWLRDDAVLVIGSGNMVHNIRQWMRDPGGPFDWARAFDRAATNALENRDFTALANYTTLPGAELAVPTPEHFLPALVIAGMSAPSDKLQMTEYPPISLENCSMRSFAFVSTSESTTRH
ncbi:dioxygenase [Litorivivens sp.]|uniref:dioxygenase family protein n=1 Tax=Litorivivens sp. TaxID=2020868 RepID=UPI00356A8200